MEEKRKNKRFVLEAELEMERIDGSKMKNVPVSILDASKSGIGFVCSEVLEINSVYKIKLKIWSGDIIDTFVNIVRFDNSGDEYIYGGVFIGMVEKDASKFSIFELFEAEKEKQEGDK